MKSFLVLLAIFLMTACQPKPKDSTTSTDTTAILHEEEEDGGELALNNGSKWNADSITNVNVAALSKIVTERKPATLEEYHSMALDLQAGIEKLLTDCRMKGADHEALHHWLEPVMETNNKLVRAATAEEATALFNAEQEQISIYADYFE